MFLANVDCAAADGFISVAGKARSNQTSLQDALLKCTSKYYFQLKAAVDAAAACQKLVGSNTTNPCRAAIARALTAAIHNSGKDPSERVQWLGKQVSSINDFVATKMPTEVLTPRIPTGREAKAIMKHRDSPDNEPLQWRRCTAPVAEHRS